MRKLNRYCKVVFLFGAMLSLAGCSKNEPVAPPGFETIETTKAEEPTYNAFGIMNNDSTGETREVQEETHTNVDTQATTSSEDFSYNREIDLNDASKTDEEYQIDRSEKETEAYMYKALDGQYHNFSEDFGAQGILQYIDNYGGVDEIRKYKTKEQFKQEMTETYIMATQDEIEDIVSMVFDGTREEQKEVDDAAEHTGDNWVYTDEGWVDLYSQGNTLNSDIGNLEEHSNISYEEQDTSNIIFKSY